MNIFIDESGSFVSAPSLESWNCVVAYMTPEGDRRPLRDALAKLKRGSNISTTTEMKLKSADEDKYFEFLHALTKLNGVMYVVATDAGVNDPNSVVSKQKEQVNKITRNKPIMKYPEGREAVQLLADQVAGLSPQLYVQLLCQVFLISARPKTPQFIDFA